MTIPTRADGGIRWHDIFFDDVRLVFWWLTRDGGKMVVPQRDFGPLVAAHTRERCAKIAIKHRGEAAKRRKMRGQSLSSFTDEQQAEIWAEERGEDIAAEMIAAEIRRMED